MESAVGLPSGECPRTTVGVLRGLDPTAEGYRAGIETLCRRYWSPIRRYARAAWADSDSDADDLTQDFFVWLLETETLQRYRLDRGSFRNFLKGLLRNFGRNARRTARRQKRGGGSEPIPLDPDANIPDLRSTDAEVAFDAAFVRELTARAMKTVKERLLPTDRAVQWRIFEEHELKPEAERPTYRDLAARHGVGERDVRNYLHRVRNVLREEMRLELADTVASADDLEAEWKHVVG